MASSKSGWTGSRKKKRRKERRRGQLGFLEIDSSVTQPLLGPRRDALSSGSDGDNEGDSKGTDTYEDIYGSDSYQETEQRTEVKVDFAEAGVSTTSASVSASDSFAQKQKQRRKRRYSDRRKDKMKSKSKSRVDGMHADEHCTLTMTESDDDYFVDKSPRVAQSAECARSFQRPPRRGSIKRGAHGRHSKSSSKKMISAKRMAPMSGGTVAKGKLRRIPAVDELDGSEVRQTPRDASFFSVGNGGAMFPQWALFWSLLILAAVIAVVLAAMTHHLRLQGRRSGGVAAATGGGHHHHSHGHADTGFEAGDGGGGNGEAEH